MANNNNNKVLNVPNLRFKEFTVEWKAFTFNDIAEYKKGPFGSALKKDLFVPQSDTTIKVYEQQNAIKKDETLGRYYISEDYYNKSLKGFTVKGSDIIISCAGTIGEMFILPRKIEKGVINQALMRVRVNENIMNKKIFMCVFDNMINSFTRKFSNGSAIKNIPPFADLKAYIVFLPSKDEQTKIALLLSKLDERIAVQTKIINKLQSLIKGLNNDFHNNIDGIATSFSYFGETYSGLSGKNAASFGSGKPYITYLNVYQNDHIDNSKYDYVAISDGEKQGKVAYGDVLFTLSSETANEVGIGSVYLGKDEELYLNSFCFGIHIKDCDIIYPPYMAYFVSSQYFRKAIYPLAQGSTRFNLQKSDFMKKKFVLPSLKRQKQVACVLNSLSEKISTEKQQLSLLETGKRYLLQQMFI